MSKKKSRVTHSSHPSKQPVDISLQKIRLIGNSLLKCSQAQESSKRMRNAPRSAGMVIVSSFDRSQIRNSCSYNPRIDAARVSLDASQKQKDYKSTNNVFRDSNEDPLRQNIESRYLKRIYHQQFNEVVAASDILLEVLDARDPLACRLIHFEKMIFSKYGKRKTIFLLLNKIDLIPHEIAILWKHYFDSQGLLNIPFCTGKISRYAKPTKWETKSDGDLAANCTDAVFKEIRKISKTDFGVHRNVTVGVVGLPNVGKSSVINALKRRDVLAVSAHAGSTKSTSTVDLKKTVKILDCPGIITNENIGDWNMSLNNFIMVNAIKVNDVSDPLAAFEYIVGKVGCKTIAEHFDLDFLEDENPCELVERIGRAHGRLLPGAKVDREAAARTFLYHWSTGKIKFYTLPPDEDGEKTYHVGNISATQMSEIIPETEFEDYCSL